MDSKLKAFQEKIMVESDKEMRQIELDSQQKLKDYERDMEQKLEAEKLGLV